MANFLYQMAWHTGSALSQTLFSCLYIDKLLSMRPNSLEYATFGTPPMHCVEGKALIDNILRPYCVSLVKCCGYVNRQVPMENIYEVCKIYFHLRMGADALTDWYRKRILSHKHMVYRYFKILKKVTY
jgi:hypothetical protein